MEISNRQLDEYAKRLRTAATIVLELFINGAQIKVEKDLVKVDTYDNEIPSELKESMSEHADVIWAFLSMLPSKAKRAYELGRDGDGSCEVLLGIERKDLDNKIIAIKNFDGYKLVLPQDSLKPRNIS